MFYVELSRAALDGDYLRGYAAVYGEPCQAPVKLGSQILPAGSEVIERGAFDGVPWMDGVIHATVNHNPAMSLGTTASGAVLVVPDAKGLAFEIDLSRSADLGRQVRAGIENGSYRGMSFTATAGEVVSIPGKVVHKKFSTLKEISVVRVPAYAGAIAREAAHQTVREQLLRARYRVLMGRESK